MPPAPVDTKFRAELKGYLLVMFLSVCAGKVVMDLHMQDIDMLTAAARGVTEGHPHWLAYQNRLLGPYVLLLLSRAGLDYQAAWVLFHTLLLHVNSCLLFYLLRRMAVPPREAVVQVMIFLFSFMVLQHAWFYTWDSVDLLLFTVLAYGILSGAPFRLFLLLFVVGIVNRESALLIAAFIALDAFEIDARRMRLKVIAAWKLLAGGGLIVAGIIYTRLIRQALFISRPDGTADTAHEMIGNHFSLLANLKAVFFYNFLEGQAVYSVAILGVACYFMSRWREMADRQVKCFLMLLAILLNIMLFGLAYETRLYFIAIPFALLLAVSLTRETRS